MPHSSSPAAGFGTAVVTPEYEIRTPCRAISSLFNKVVRLLHLWRRADMLHQAAPAASHLRQHRGFDRRYSLHRRAAISAKARRARPAAPLKRTFHEKHRLIKAVIGATSMWRPSISFLSASNNQTMPSAETSNSLSEISHHGESTIAVDVRGCACVPGDVALQPSAVCRHFSSCWHMRITAIASHHVTQGPEQ